MTLSTAPPISDVMFGLPSFTKLLVLAAVIAAVWYGFKLVARLDKQRKEEGRLPRKAQPPKSAGAAAREPVKAEGNSEDMEPCSVCGAYVAGHGAASCGRASCPY